MGRVSPSEAPAADVVPQPDDITRLLREQAPRLADLPVRASPTSGSSNWVFRLGERWAVRLPRTDAHVSDLLNEVRWLPRLAASLPAPVPRVVAVGEPSEVCPRPWIVVSWLSGDRPARLDAPAQSRFARTLGEFLCALHEVDTGGVPAGAAHWGYRCGEPVIDTIDEWADRAATALADLFDEAAVREAWRRLRDVPPATRPACLVHTDVSSENVLVGHDGRLTGVIDVGGTGVGDRSVDLLYAWSMLDDRGRHELRLAADVDEATWIRARAWAFVGPGLLTLADHRDTMPERTERVTRMVEAVAADVGVRLR